MDGPRSERFTLFARMMDEPPYRGRLCGDVSSIAQINRPARYLRDALRREDWHPRLLNGSTPARDIAVVRIAHLASEGFVDEHEAEVLAEMRRYNAVLFDCLLKRRFAADGRRLLSAVFETGGCSTRILRRAT